MIELSAEELSIAWPLLRDFPHKQDFIHSVYERKQRGRVFVDDKVQPKAAVLFHAGGNAILSGHAQSRPASEFLTKMSVPLMMGNPWMQFVADSEAWDPVIIGALGQRVTKVPRLSFLFNREDGNLITGWRSQLSRNQTVHRVDETLLARIAAEYHNHIVEDWGSAEKFLEHGVGFCLIADGRIATVCYSVTSGKRIVPIQIDTRDGYRRKGLAFATSAAFIEHCLEDGLRPRWECDVSNVASVSLARKLGFTLEAELTVFRVIE